MSDVIIAAPVMRDVSRTVSRMKKCRHCGTQNEDGAISCSECGLDLGPSPAAQLAAKLPSAIGAINTKWLWRLCLVIGIPILLLAVYLLSLGPILRFYEAKPSSVWSRVPGVVRAMYEPLDRMPIPEALGRPLRRYNQWWMGVEKDEREFRSLMARIDGSITNGVPQAEVTRLLGEPITWSTNADTVEAHYFYMPEVVLYGGYFTNGFNIAFSNGAVVRKSYATTGR